MPSVRAISDQTGFIEGKLTNRRLIAARTEGSRATLSVPRSSVVAAHLLHERKNRPRPPLQSCHCFGRCTFTLSISLALPRRAAARILISASGLCTG
jgi:hypothetical protein